MKIDTLTCFISQMVNAAPAADFNGGQASDEFLTAWMMTKIAAEVSDFWRRRSIFLSRARTRTSMKVARVCVCTAFVGFYLLRGIVSPYSGIVSPYRRSYEYRDWSSVDQSPPSNAARALGIPAWALRYGNSQADIALRKPK
jgi:hypothetical protein